MKMNFYISDTHFFHHKIISLCNRPFADDDEMTLKLIENWNSVVSPYDTVYHLGDFSWGTYEMNLSVFSRLNGTKHLIIGNHDFEDTTNLPWASVSPYMEINENGVKVVLFHYPIVEHNRFFRNSPEKIKSVSLYGHVHSTPDNIKYNKVNPYSYEVGVDLNNFTPVTLNQIIKKILA